MFNNNKKSRLITKLISAIDCLFRLLLLNCSKIKYLSGVKRILVIELWGIGDLIMMSAIIRPLRDRFPSASIDLLAKPMARDVFEGEGLFDEFIEFSFPWTSFKGKYRIWHWDWSVIIALIKRLRRKKYDLILDARGDIRNNMLSWLINGRIRFGYHWTGGSFFVTESPEFDYKNKHRVEAWVNILSYLGIKVTNPHPCLTVSLQECSWSEKFLSQAGVARGDLLVAIHPGARIKTRCWPLERFARVAEYVRDKHRARVIVLVEPDGYGENIPLNGDFLKVKCSLRQMIALISKVDLLVCNDGGPMHIGTAVNVPVLGIFGSTNPVWFGPYGQGHKIVMKDDFSCRPCFDYCRFKEPLCLTSITVDEVIKKLDIEMKEILLKNRI